MTRGRRTGRVHSPTRGANVTSLSIKAHIKTLLTIVSPQGQRKLTIKGYGRNSVQTGREANWQLAYQRAFEDYLKRFDEAASNNGLDGTRATGQ